MRLALIGTGRTGSVVDELASERGHEVVARFHSERPFLEENDMDVLEDADMAIDFSLPELALDHIHRYCLWGQPAVIGTTGWYESREKVADWVHEGQIGLLYASNFSIGMAVVRRAVRYVGGLMDELPDYDAFIREMHHTGKVDSPSGTAFSLASELVDQLDRKERVETETQHGKIDPVALHVTSTRAGSVYGEHTVGFDSPYDQITINHDAKGREGFAFGALRAAEWLQGRTGLFTLEDMLGDWFSEDASSDE